MNYKPTIFDDSADVDKLNNLLDQLLEKPFLSPTVAINAVRGALDLYGIVLPPLDVETQIEGPDAVDAHSYLATGKRTAKEALNTEYLFKIVDANHDDDVKAHLTKDWDNRLYLYFVLDRNDELGVYEAYAQIVDESEVSALIDEDIPQELKDLYPDLMGDDINGEDKYLRQIRHSGTGGFTGEV